MYDDMYPIIQWDNGNNKQTDHHPHDIRHIMQWLVGHVLSDDSGDLRLIAEQAKWCNESDGSEYLCDDDKRIGHLIL